MGGDIVLETLAPQRWEGTAAPEAGARRKQTPPRLAEATGPASCGLRPAQEPVTLAFVVWLGRPGCVGTGHTLARYAKEETLPQMDSVPVFLEKCGERGSSLPRSGIRVSGRWQGKSRSAKATSWEFMGGKGETELEWRS